MKFKPFLFVKEMLLIHLSLLVVADVNYISIPMQRRKSTKPMQNGLILTNLIIN